MTDILSSSTAAKPAAATASYEPRPSTRVRGANLPTAGDGDVWHEHLVVCEAQGNKLVIRSYFKNSRTKKKVWDEPPTGASTIEPASAGKRAEAEGELKTLQAAMDGVSADASSYDASGENGPQKSKKGRGFFGAFRKKTKGTKNGSSGTTANAKIGGMFGKSTSKKGNRANNAKNAGGFDMDGDEDIQRAISLSMGLQQDTTVNSQQTAFNKFNKNDQWQDDQEALEMARAISMSEAEANGQGNAGASSFSPAAAAATTTVPSVDTNTNTSNTEEEMLQKAIEESRREHAISKNVASYGMSEMPSQQEASLLEFSATDYNSAQIHHAQQQPAAPYRQQDLHDHPYATEGNDGFLDQKMPAKATNLKKPPPAAAAAFAPNSATSAPSFASMPAGTNTMSFDPYAQGMSTAGATMKPAIGDSYSHDNGPVLRKMDEQDDRKPAANLGRFMYNKKSMEDEAGVV